MRLLTRDLYEGAYLMSQGMELNEIWVDGCNGKRAVVFEFVGDNADVLRKDYQRGNAQVNILKLKSSLNELKDRMFNVLRNGDFANGGKKGDRDEIYRDADRRDKKNRPAAINQI